MTAFGLFLFLGTFALSLWATWRVKAAFSKYSEVPASSGLTGAEVAQRIMMASGIYDVQIVESIHVDCDADVLLLKVRQQGGACHEGYHSCFFRRLNETGTMEVVATPMFNAEEVYAADREPSGDNVP